MTWILTICTAGWVLCGSLKEIEYPTDAHCYKAMDTLYAKQGKAAFNYVTCSPKKAP
jgi:hypothetical protein